MRRVEGGGVCLSCMYGEFIGWMDGWMNRRMGDAMVLVLGEWLGGRLEMGRMDGWMDGWDDVELYYIILYCIILILSIYLSMI